MKTIRKILLAVLCACLLLTGCSSGEAAMTFGKTQISENVFRYWLSYYKNIFLNTYKDIDNTAESFAMVLENGQTAEEYLYNQTVENVQMTLICMELFRQNGLSLSSALEEQIDDYVDDILKEYADGNKKTLNAALSVYGVNMNMLREIYRDQEKSGVLFDYMYGTNGTTPVTEEEYTAYYEDNYCHIRHIYVNNQYYYVTDENGNSVSSSESSGLQVNDTIVRINGMRIYTDTDLSYKLQYTNDNDFTVDVRRNGEIVTLEHVRFEDTATTGRLDFWVYGQKPTVGSVLSYAAKNTYSIARMTWVCFLDLIRGNVGFHDMSGPVGIVNAIGEAATLGETLREHVLSLLSLSTLVTINLGFCNLLPLPALDGGRLVFLIIEAIRRKPIKPEHEGMVHLVGMGLLMLLMLAVTYNDIVRLIQ